MATQKVKVTQTTKYVKKTTGAGYKTCPTCKGSGKVKK